MRADGNAGRAHGPARRAVFCRDHGLYAGVAAVRIYLSCRNGADLCSCHFSVTPSVFLLFLNQNHAQIERGDICRCRHAAAEPPERLRRAVRAQRVLQIDPGLLRGLRRFAVGDRTGEAVRCAGVPEAAGAVRAARCRPRRRRSSGCPRSSPPPPCSIPDCARRRRSPRRPSPRSRRRTKARWARGTALPCALRRGPSPRRPVPPPSPPPADIPRA